jgi:hypothetical protein
MYMYVYRDGKERRKKLGKITGECVFREKMF